jgi:hypothetical protein
MALATAAAVGAATAVPMADAVGGVRVVMVAVGRATGTEAEASCVPVSKSVETDVPIAEAVGAATAVPMAAAVGGVSVVIVADGRITGNDAEARA